VPYLPFGAAVAVAAWRAVTHGSLDRVSQLTILVVVLVVAVRQMVVLSDNVALARQLEAKVERRTAQLHHREFHDGLTGLANRALFNQYLDNATQRQGRSGACLAVLVIDLYDFTGLNQLHGSAVGDELLCAVAARLQATLRGADTVARVGGDEFAALLEGPPAELCAERAAQRVLAGLEGPYVVGSNALTVEASIGVATYALGTTSGEVLVRNAGLAMHAAKERGRHCYEVYAEPVHSVIRERMQTEAELSGALDRRELVLHYQPVVAMAAGSVRGVEALVRWQHPERGLLAPDMFVPTAERTGLIVSIGAWVLHQACSDVVALTTEAQPLALSVNLSARQLEDEDLVAMVRRALTDCGFEAHRLTLEVTESAIMADVARAAYVLQELRELGAKIAIDDFGTGYSTLSALRHLPVDTLKIDKSFVADIAHDRASEDLVRRTLQLASDFCLHTVAEGVEGPEQLEALRRLGCRSAQGFFFSRPIPVEELHSLLQDRPDGWSGRAPRSPLPNTRAGLLKHCS
jgi:diguanylate cyclase (GGDEF)-like protein